MITKPKGYSHRGYSLGQKIVHKGDECEIIAFNTKVIGDDYAFIILEKECNPHRSRLSEYPNRADVVMEGKENSYHAVIYESDINSEANTSSITLNYPILTITFKYGDSVDTYKTIYNLSTLAFIEGEIDASNI